MAVGKKVTNLSKGIADVNVLNHDNGEYEVVVCFSPDPEIIVGEGNSKALIALDGSRSMRKVYGGAAGPFGGSEPNYVEPMGRGIAKLLCEVTKSGKVDSIYWAVGQEGNQIEIIGAHNEEEWEDVSLNGPKSKMGTGTYILPVIQYIVETVAKNSDWTMGVIITDGIIDDEEASIQYCFELGKKMAEGNIKPIKLVLIGIGESVNEAQLQRFDDMFEESDIDYDLWSHGVTSSFRNIEDVKNVLYGELISEDTFVADSAVLKDDKGNVIKSFSDGLPGKFRFNISGNVNGFVIEANGISISQDISEAL